MILHIPHSSRLIPSDLRSAFVLDEPALKAELLLMTDAHTDDLFGSLAMEGDAIVTFPVSRLVIDPERFQDDSVEVMARIGMGVVYERTLNGAPLRDAPSCDERDALIQRFYEPHHERLSLATKTELNLHGRALIIDCHSFPAAPLAYELDQDPNRPDICIGTDEYHTPQALIRAAKQAVADEGLTYRINRPFAGTLVPATYWQCEQRVSSIMIEINRNLYMNESTGKRLARYEHCKAAVGRIVERVREAEKATQRSSAESGRERLEKMSRKIPHPGGLRVTIFENPRVQRPKKTEE